MPSWGSPAPGRAIALDERVLLWSSPAPAKCGAYQLSNTFFKGVLRLRQKDVCPAHLDAADLALRQDRAGFGIGDAQRCAGQGDGHRAASQTGSGARP